MLLEREYHLSGAVDMGAQPGQEFQHPLVETFSWMSIFSCVCMVLWLHLSALASISLGGMLPLQHKLFVVLAPNTGFLRAGVAPPRACAPCPVQNCRDGARAGFWHNLNTRMERANLMRGL